MQISIAYSLGGGGGGVCVWGGGGGKAEGVT